MRNHASNRPKRAALRIAAIVLLLTASGLGWAPVKAAVPTIHPDLCQSHDQYYRGQAPKIIDERLSRHGYRICMLAYDTRYSGVTETPLWSAEHLTRARMRAHKGVHRTNNFHAQEGIPRQYQSALSDYRHSGYDRGHMAPAGDMPSHAAMRQSFSLANMAPQKPHDNRYLWEGIEVATRDMAWKGNDLYVVSGPISTGRSTGCTTMPRFPTICSRPSTIHATTAPGSTWSGTIATTPTAWSVWPT